MMSTCGNGGKKWSCEYCTFENWPTTKKCTMCRAPRPPQFIHDEAPAFDQDIYNTTPLICPPVAADPQASPTSPTSSPSPTSSQSTIDNALSSKWACQMCTYLNWQKITKCAQCLTPRPKVVPVINPSATLPLSINVNSGQVSNPLSSLARHTPPRTSPSSPEAAKALNNDKNKAVVAATKHGKWTCKVCTYDNWPRASKCVLCGVSRGHAHIEDLGTISGSSSDSEDPRRAAASSSRRRSPPSSLRGTPDGTRDMQHLLGATALPGGGTSPRELRLSSDNNSRVHTEGTKLRQIRNRLREVDWLWLNACQGVVQGDTHAVEAYIGGGGDPGRQLTADECILLNRPSAYQLGYTLVHLAIRFHREDTLAALLTATDVVGKSKKRSPPHCAPDIAADILRDISSSTRQRKGDFPCYFLTQTATFALPAEIEDLPNALKKQLFAELLDQDVQKELEEEEPVINWNVELVERHGSRLFALWNRTAGDCLLDSVLQASWGVMDKDNTLRRSLADSLYEGACMFYPRWKETESAEAQMMHFSLEESQWQQDWAILLSIASQPGASLEQIHVFALAHILRRPIIVYGIKYVKSFRGENLSLAKFQGVYLPLLWEQSFCWKSPIVLGYTRGHFSALVAMETDMFEGAGARANIENNEEGQFVYLPLMDCEGKLFPVHFHEAAELGHEEAILRNWLDCDTLNTGLLVAKQTITKPPMLVRQMLSEWLDRYRRLAQMVASTPQTTPRTTSSPSPASSGAPVLSSDDETDDE